MGRLSPHHRELTNGVGKCSVPMWCNGLPADFCDRPAFGERPNGDEFTTSWGERHRFDGRYAGYVPGLACPVHGGPPPSAGEGYCPVRVWGNGDREDCGRQLAPGSDYCAKHTAPPPSAEEGGS